MVPAPDKTPERVINPGKLPARLRVVLESFVHFHNLHATGQEKVGVNIPAGMAIQVGKKLIQGGPTGYNCRPNRRMRRLFTLGVKTGKNSSGPGHASSGSLRRVRLKLV